jgi:hypothetical protein
MFVFDGERRLVYRGQFDKSRPGNDLPVTGADADQRSSIGCGIKWR